MGLENIKELLDDLVNNLHSQKEMNRLGLAAIRKIKKRTRKGIDVDGQPFEAYSAAHAKRRAALGLPTTPVNLQINDVDGMIAKIDHLVAGNFESVALDITDPEKRKLASYHDSEGVGTSGAHIRHFWGLSTTEQDEIRDLVDGDIDNLLAKLSRKHSDP